MSGVVKTIGKIAGVVAAVTAFIPGLQPVSLIAAGVSAAANITATIIGPSAPKRPAIQGSISNITIGADQATPMMIGNIYSGGALVHQAGYGAAVDGVSNPYLAMAVVYSAGGPIAGIDSYWSDFAQLSYGGSAAAGSATGYFNGFLYWRSQNGATPEGGALSPQWGGLPGWGSTYKLSGYAATLWSLKWDSKEGKFTSGVPRIGIQGRGVLTWDPRKDSTWPGGAGPQRWVDPRANPAGFAATKATWAYTDRPGLHALRYALGTWERDPAAASDAPWILSYGVGIPIDGLVVADFVELENVCEANGWTCNGIVLEPGDKWDNLKRILEAGGAEPCFKGGRLGCKITAPRVALDTIGRDDIADGTIEAAGAQPRTDRINTVLPKFRSPAHKWELQQSDEIVISDYLAEDKEEKRREEAFEFVTNATQAAQLATYRLFDSREQGPIELRCKPRLRRYAGGDMLTLTDDLRDDLGLAQNNVVVLRRAVDPITMVVTLTLVTENQLKHIAAMAVTGTAPATITLPTTQQIDRNSGVNDVLDQIEALADDGLLTRFEKITKLIPLSVQLADRWNLLDAQAAALTGFAEVVSARAAASAAYSAWIAYRNGLSPAWNDAGADTVVDRATFNSRINTLQAALDTLDQAIKRAATAINGFNRLRNTRFENGTSGWVVGQANASINAIDTITVNGISALKITATAGSSAPLAYVFQDFSCGPDEWLAARVGIEGQYNVTLQDAYVQCLDASGNAISSLYLGGLYGPQSFNTKLKQIFKTVTGTVKGRFVVYFNAGASGGLFTGLIAEPMVSSAVAGQTDFPPFSPGVSDGAAGVPGAPGADGQTLYTWVAYADSADGTIGFTTGTPGGRGYQGLAFNKTTPLEGTDPAAYTWGPYRGPANFGLVSAGKVAIGPDYIVRSAPWNGTWDASAYSSEAFVAGAVTSTTLTASSGGTMFGLNTDPTTGAGYDTIDYAFYPENTYGGSGMLYIYENGVGLATGRAWAPGEVLTISYDNKTVTYYHNGTVVRQVGAPSGLRLFFDSSLADFNGRISNIKFGPAGSAGADGINTATINIFQRGATAPALPTAPTTYDFAAKSLTGLNNGWSTTIPAGTAPLWQSAATAAGQGATDTIAASEWAGAVQIAANGANAASSAPVLLYNRTGTPSAPAVPSTQVGYDFGTGVASGMNNGWTQSLPASGGAYRWQINATAVSTSGSDTIAPGEWSAPNILAQDGANGTNGANGIDALSVSISPAAATVPCTANGTPKAALPSAQITAFKGATGVTASATYSYTASGLSGISISGSGAITVTGMSADSGFIEVTASKDGASQKAQLVFSKVKDGPPYVFDHSAVSPPSSTSFETVAYVALLMGPNGTIGFDTNGGFQVNSGTVNVIGTVDYSLNNGAGWTTAAGFTGNGSSIGSEGDWASANTISGSSIGLSGKQTVLFRVTMRKTTTQTFSDFVGDFAVSWSG